MISDGWRPLIPSRLVTVGARALAVARRNPATLLQLGRADGHSFCGRVHRGPALLCDRRRDHNLPASGERGRLDLPGYRRPARAAAHPGRIRRSGDREEIRFCLAGGLGRRLDRLLDLCSGGVRPSDVPPAALPRWPLYLEALAVGGLVAWGTRGPRRRIAGLRARPHSARHREPARSWWHGGRSIRGLEPRDGRTRLAL